MWDSMSAIPLRWSQYEKKEENNMNYSEALQKVKEGYKVARQGWNGKKMCVYLAKGSSVPYHDLKQEVRNALDVVRSEELGNIQCQCDIKIHDHIDMVNAQGEIIVGWVASQTDTLAEDWILLQ